MTVNGNAVGLWALSLTECRPLGEHWAYHPDHYLSKDGRIVTHKMAFGSRRPGTNPDDFSQPLRLLNPAAVMAPTLFQDALLLASARTIRDNKRVG